jgi:hypothetical protein
MLDGWHGIQKAPFQSEQRPGQCSSEMGNHKCSVNN